MPCRPYKVRMADGLEGVGDICITSLVPAEEDAAVRKGVILLFCTAYGINVIRRTILLFSFAVQLILFAHQNFGLCRNNSWNTFNT